MLLSVDNRMISFLMIGYLNDFCLKNNNIFK